MLCFVVCFAIPLGVLALGTLGAFLIKLSLALLENACPSGSAVLSFLFLAVILFSIPTAQLFRQLVPILDISKCQQHIIQHELATYLPI